MPEALLEARNLSKRYALRAHPLAPPSGWVEALRDIRLTVYEGECVGLVGESGSGKSTLARALCGLVKPDSGTLRRAGALRSVQMVFQDPSASLDPLQRIGNAIAEPMAVHRLARGAALKEKAASLLNEVGLDPAWTHRLPRTLSGGQRQRVAIARALALDPAVLICDEPLSALDLSIQAQILELLSGLQRKRRMAILFISHNLLTVGAIADRILVMKSGAIVEEGLNPGLLENPQHPYTRLLVECALKTV